MTTREMVIEALQGVPATDHYIAEIADGILSALGLQEGGPNRIVPREPTEAMVAAGWDVHPGLIGVGSTQVSDCYRAMLAEVRDDC